MPNEGFQALLGTGLGHAEAENPLIKAGAHRWIISLPHPGERVCGRLLINPRPEEREGFVPLQMTPQAGFADAVVGCLKVGTDVTICLPTLLDTGALGIGLVNVRQRQIWPPGTAAALSFGSSSSFASATIEFTTGQRVQASRLTFVRDGRVPGGRIRSGLLAYFAFDILYDADEHSIAVRARSGYSVGLRGYVYFDGGTY